MGILVIIVIVFFIVAFFLVMFGVTAKPRLKPINILAQSGSLNKICMREKVSCNTDKDCLENCTEAQEGEEIVCKSLPDIPTLPPSQQKLFGSKDPIPPPKYCVPAKAKLDCNASTGGVPVFTGWGGLDTMEFDCLCTYPLWASSRVCDTSTGTCTGNCLLNPGICQPGKLNWDLKVNAKEPMASMCQCDDGYVMVVDESGLPRCVKKDMDTYYSDIDFVTGIQGGQPKIPVDSVEMKLPLNSACADSKSSYTNCNGKCCTMPNAVCCGNGMCCPSDYPVCNTEYMRCLKTETECQTAETKCSKGCCNTQGGVCCGDGLNCCPTAFPNCDPDLPYCNPNPIPLVQSLSQGEPTEGVQCANGICPSPDGVCCGSLIDGKAYCCPSDYPVCDTKLKMCRKAH